MNYYLYVLKNFANFSGRARRKEYWMFFLFNFLFAMAAMVVDRILGTTFKMDLMHTGQPMSMGYGYIYLAYGLFTFIPGLAAAVRRLHDVNKSGWWFLIVLIPLIGGIWLLVLLCTGGTVGPNNYGADPKGVNEEPGAVSPA